MLRCWYSQHLRSLHVQMWLLAGNPDVHGLSRDPALYEAQGPQNDLRQIVERVSLCSAAKFFRSLLHFSVSKHFLGRLVEGKAFGQRPVAMHLSGQLPCNILLGLRWPVAFRR